MPIDVCVETDVGLKRTRNEDSYQLVYDRREGYDIDSFGMLFAIADGMGGHAAGQVASRTACKGLLTYYAGKMAPETTYDPVEARLRRLEKVVWEIQDQICRFRKGTSQYANMGTTLSVLVLYGGYALTAHVGDSRIYRLRNDVLEQLTVDETMAQLSLEMGLLRPDDIPDHPLGHVLTQALGEGLEEVHTRVERAKIGDIFLPSTDGLHDSVADDEVKEILRINPAGQQACDRLIEAALERGGKDNMTVIVVRVQ